MARGKTRSTPASVGKKFSAKILLSVFFLVAASRSKRLSRFVARAILRVSGQKTVLSQRELVDLASAASGGGSWFSLRGLLTGSVLAAVIYASYRFVYLEFQKTGKLPFARWLGQDLGDAEPGIRRVAEGVDEEIKAAKEQVRLAREELEKKKSQNAELLAVSKQLAKNLEDRNAEVARLKSFTEVKNQNVQGLRQQILVLERRLREFKTELERAKRANEALRDKGTKYRAQISKLKGQNAQLFARARTQTVDSQIAKLVTRIDEKNRQIEEIYQVFEKNRQDFQQNVRLYDKLSAKKQKGDAEIADLKVRLQIEKKYRQEAEQKLREKSTQLADADETTEEYKRRYEEEKQRLSDEQRRLRREASNLSRVSESSSFLARMSSIVRNFTGIPNRRSARNYQSSEEEFDVLQVGSQSASPQSPARYGPDE